MNVWWYVLDRQKKKYSIVQFFCIQKLTDVFAFAANAVTLGARQVTAVFYRPRRFNR